MSPTPGFDTQDADRIRRLAMRSMFDLFEGLCEGTVVVDRDARVVWMSEKYAVKLGLRSAADALGEEIEKVVPGSQMREVVRSGKPVLLDLMQLGDETMVVTRIPLRDDAGELIGAVGFALYDRLQYLKPLVSKFAGLQSALASAEQRLAQERRAKYTFSTFIGASAPVQELKRQARRAAQLAAPVLLLGETGTGKELLAQAIHGGGPRAHRPFVAINVAAIPEALLEAELFGVVAGAFTGADRRGREGKFRLADGGTLFLDEIADMPLAMQVKLLRVLQEQELEPLGSDRVVRVDVRIIAASSIDLATRVADGRFRADLYYRLNVLALRVPPMRERLSDLEALCEDLLDQIARRTGTAVREIGGEAMDVLRTHDWPGNVRELANLLERAAMMSDTPVLGADEIGAVLETERGVRAPGMYAAGLARAQVRETAPAAREAGSASDAPSRRAQGNPAESRSGRYDEARVEFERRMIRDTLARTGGKVPEAAKLLGIGRATLYKKLSALGLSAR